MKRLNFYRMLFPGLMGLPLLSCSNIGQTPEEALRIAQSYADLEWMPETRHIRHGKDLKGITVHTPDTTLKDHGDDRGWWRPGVLAKGMAYKWGGFDTPESFIKGIKAGKKAGDIANAYKISRDNRAVSRGSVGVDCSGFISRCWGFSCHVSTRDMHKFSDPVAWEDLRAGDILLKRGHVILFVKRQGNHIIGMESGATPTWRVRTCALPMRFLTTDGYSPRRYRGMTAPDPQTRLPEYTIDFTGMEQDRYDVRITK
jgi:hypothetical protein